MVMSRYQYLGIGVSLLSILANLFTLGLGPESLGLIIFTTGALVQVSAAIAYRFVSIRPLPSLILIWLAVGAQVLSILFGFFSATAVIFAILLLFSLIAAAGTAASFPISRIKKVAIAFGGLAGVFVLNYFVIAVLFS